MRVESLKALPREAHGSRAACRLRQSGLVPGVLYGHGQEPNAVAVERQALDRLLAHGTHVVNLEIDGRTESCLVKDVQYDHLGAAPIHVDLARIDLNERVRLKVPLELKGHARGLSEGGALIQQMIDMEIECLVANLPDSLRVNVSDLHVGGTIHVKDVPLPEGVTALSDPESIIVLCREVTARVEEAALTEAAAATEPEVIAKGKVETEGEGEEE